MRKSADKSDEMKRDSIIGRLKNINASVQNVAATERYECARVCAQQYELQIEHWRIVWSMFENVLIFFVGLWGHFVHNAISRLRSRT